MGNTSSSKDRSGEETVDFGYLVPQGAIYASANHDWNQAVVAQLIVHRKLAPFYKPLEDYEDGWDVDQILAAQKKPSSLEAGPSSSAIPSDDAQSGAGNASSAASMISHNTSSSLGGMSSAAPHLQSATSALRHAAGKSVSRSNQAHKEYRQEQVQQQQQRAAEAQLYRGAVDCPICFLVRHALPFSNHECHLP